MNDWTLELHGSEVQWTELDDGQLRLRLSAALVHRRTKQAPEEEGHVKGLELRFTCAQVIEADLAACLGALSASTVVVDGVRHRRLPLPFDAAGDIRAELDFKSGTTLILSARSVHCAAPEDGTAFRPAYAC